ncbi:16S rRNA (guanine(527)-N(7))-methyltransferase RsmG [Tenuibacillus multivorans]|uniref:Ribosomal RNA small subunit methyltransferase G n=1 Tax=Tenuibacillus multivorans TaxID=237069 RepID=A0A1G9W699_9BACI|nr:16S rRNA (guanine(527)-N(7))-methyltransferase RsmG [Tenuibacillus multivorans]GEL76329.1 ribosomal RNA small subunit methyltransferase G [Tenuibacillus multivorans]SDM80052.1 16S rRNA (guanine527-N7)-methyltransferase [Tenuibacillus multivorans]
MNEKVFIDQLKKHGIDLTEEQRQQFNRYYEVLVEWNEKMNLTAITDQKEVYLKHFFDSISAAFYVDFSMVQSICDVGAGAGFPSIPLKIIYPHLKVTIVDSLKKRITFLNHLADQLNLDGVAFYHDRAETFGRNQQHREKYDVVMARAVARTSVLSELCLPLVRSGGQLIMMKGANFSNEKEQGDMAIKTLGGEWYEVYQFYLPHEGSERHIAVVNKNRKTPKKYPRKPGTPNKTPLE